MRSNELEKFGKNKRLEENINKLAEQLYKSIAGELPALNTALPGEEKVGPDKLEHYLKDTSFYAPVQVAISKQKKTSKKRITLEDVRKFRNKLEKSQLKHDQHSSKIKLNRRLKTIV